jgi:hypothetical protein
VEHGAEERVHQLASSDHAASAPDLVLDELLEELETEEVRRRLVLLQTDDGVSDAESVERFGVEVVDREVHLSEKPLDAEVQTRLPVRVLRLRQPGVELAVHALRDHVEELQPVLLDAEEGCLEELDAAVAEVDVLLADEVPVVGGVHAGQGRRATS